MRVGFRVRRLPLFMAVLLVVSTAMGSCRSSDIGADTEQRGDTLFVSVSGTPTRTRAAHIDLQFGAVEGDPHLSFGRLEEIALLPSGGVVVYDNHFMRLSRFDADGRFLGEMGGRGQGPGQFDAVMGLAASPDGTTYVRTYDGRVLRFSAEGEYQDEWRPAFRTAPGDPFVPSGDSLLVLKIIERAGTLTEPTVYGFVTVDRSWAVHDSTGPVRSPWDHETTRGQPALASRPFVSWSPAGFSVAGVSGRLGFEIRKRDGTSVRLEREADPIPFLREEWRDWETQNEFLRRRAGDADRYPRTPESKPPIRGVFLPSNGEIWLQRHTSAVGPDPGHVEVVAGLRATPEWLAPILFEVFESDGTYLGAVTGPPGIDVRAVSDGEIWGYRKGAFGEQYIVRLRVESTES